VRRTLTLKWPCNSSLGFDSPNRSRSELPNSNQQTVSRGHTDFPGLMRTLKGIGYDGSIIVECTASGPDPFTPVKGEGWRDEVNRYMAESIGALRMYEELA